MTNEGGTFQNYKGSQIGDYSCMYKVVAFWLAGRQVLFLN